MDALPTVDVPAVELLTEGGPYHGHGSPPEGDFFTRGDLEALARNTISVQGRVDAPLKLGHNAEQAILRDSGLTTADGKPAAGWLDRYRVTTRPDGRAVLIADVRRVPKMLASIWRAGGFRKRSLEWNPVMVDGQKVGPVITALSLLGADLPAIDTLGDIARLYSAPDTDPGDSRSTVTDNPMGGPMTDVRKSLGLAEDATDEQVAEAIKALTDGKAAAEAAQKQAEGALETATAEVAKLKADADAAAAKAEEDRKALEAAAKSGSTDEAVVKVLESLSKQVESLTAAQADQAAQIAAAKEAAGAGTEVAEQMRQMRRKDVLDSAQRDGRGVTAGNRKEWEAEFDKDEAATTRMLAAIPSNPLLKTTEIGSDDQGQEDKEAARKAQDASYTRLMARMGMDSADLVTVAEGD